MDTTWWDLHGDLVLGAIAGSIVTFVVAWIFYVLTFKGRRLVWESHGHTRILVAKEPPQGLIVKYGETKLKDPYIFTFRIGNHGREEISDTLFDKQPIKVEFADQKYLSAKLSAKSKESISPNVTEVTPEKSEIRIDPLLLLPGEWFDIQVISEGRLKPPTVHSRIAKPMEELLGERFERRAKVGFWLFLLACYATTILIWGSISKDFNANTYVGSIFIALIGGGAISVLFAVVLSRRARWPRAYDETQID